VGHKNVIFIFDNVIQSAHYRLKTFYLTEITLANTTDS